jgi:hypothetical protein
MSGKSKWGTIFILVLVTALAAAGAQRTGSASRRSSKGTHTKKSGIDPALAAAAKPLVATGCDPLSWEHVYHLQRLQVVEKCISVTGTIHHVKKEADGDDHIQLTLDSEFAGLLNDRNKTAQANSLVVEPVCQGTVTQADAQAACRDFHSTVQVPTQGTHVRVLGSYVFDSEANHGWMEIHPVTTIEAIQ